MVAETETTAAPAPTPNSSPAVIVSGTAGSAKTSSSVYSAPYAGYLHQRAPSLGSRDGLLPLYRHKIAAAAAGADPHGRRMHECVQGQESPCDLPDKHRVIRRFNPAGEPHGRKGNACLSFAH